MGCTSPEIIKICFIDACIALKMTNSFENDLILKKPKCYIIKTKSIPNFISLVKNLKILYEININEFLRNKSFNYKKDSNIELIYQESQIKEIIDNKEENEFIIVEKNFLDIMGVESDKSKEVILSIDNEHNLNEIIFPNFRTDFLKINKGIYKFVNLKFNNISSPNTIIINLYSQYSSLILQNASNSNNSKDLNNTLVCLAKNNIFPNSDDAQLNLKENSELSKKKICNVTYSKSMPKSSSSDNEIMASVLNQINQIGINT
jgi:hypothetical protein